jgi:hypothetical protein
MLFLPVFGIRVLKTYWQIAEHCEGSKNATSGKFYAHYNTTLKRGRKNPTETYIILP